MRSKPHGDEMTKAIAPCELPQVTEGQVVAAGLRRQAADLIRWAQKLEAEAAASLPAKKRDRRKPESIRSMLQREGL